MAGLESSLERDHFELLLGINNAIASILDLHELFPVISKCLRPIVQHDGGVIGVYEEETRQMHAYALDPPPGVEVAIGSTLFPVEGTPAGEAIETKNVVIVTEPDRKKYYSPLTQNLFDQGIQSGCAVPLLRGTRVIGVLALVSKRLANFSPEKAELLRGIGGQIAIALENALNFDRAQKAQAQLARERDRSQLLLGVNNAIVSHLDLKEVIKSLSSRLKWIVPNDGAFLMLHDSAHTGQLRLQALDESLLEKLPSLEEGLLLSPEGTPEGQALETKRPVLVRTPDLAGYSSPLVRIAEERGIRSGCALPVISHGRVLGALSVVSSKPNAFDDDDLKLLEQCVQQIAIAVENALSFREIQTLKNKLATEKLYLEDEIRSEHDFSELIGSSAIFQQVLKQVRTVAPTDSSVLIRGETGTGKELIARAIHALSSRSERALVKLNCSAIPTGLLESELFGHEKGAFTGAISQRIGRFELAHKGTLFLDEVGDIPAELQPKLLRVLQEQEFERLGSAKTQKVDVRLIAATNCDLEEMVSEKKYRSDLYYRISGFPISIPPLRERREDIPELARFFIQKYARRLKKNIERISNEAMDAVVRYEWPGNVRELEHFIERAVIFTSGMELEISISELKGKTAAKHSNVGSSSLKDSERQHILRALEETNWVIGGPSGAANRLGMKRTTLVSRMQKLGISRK